MDKNDVTTIVNTYILNAGAKTKTHWLKYQSVISTGPAIPGATDRATAGQAG